MATYQHILLAVDFTSETESVMRKGRELAEQMGAKVSLIHVVEYSTTIYPADIPLPTELNLDRRLIENAKVQLEEAAMTHGLADAGRFVELGQPKREIVQIAQDNDVDLIIVGSHGRHGLQILMGSTANGVLHLARCDVLAVRIGN